MEMSKYSVKTLTIVCVLRFPTVGRPEIRCLEGKQSEKVRTEACKDRNLVSKPSR